MAATDLATLRPPPGCTDWVLAAEPGMWIDGHAVTVNLTWWNSSLTERGLGGGFALIVCGWLNLVSWTLAECTDLQADGQVGQVSMVSR